MGAAVAPPVLGWLADADQDEMWADLVERWRALGPWLWLAAAAAAGVWFLAYGAVLAFTDPRRVAPGAATLDLGGPEPPAVVNLITHDWELDRSAVPATLLDLAARGHLTIEHPGERTVVGVRQTSAAAGDPLTGYEQMVLDHVRRLADDTPDGQVPAEALATGPGGASAAWWRRFRRLVVRDAKARGVSRNRWPRAAGGPLLVAAAVVGLTVAVAASTLEESAHHRTGASSQRDSDDPISGMVFLGGGAFLLLGAAVFVVQGQRDTPAGREAAARWLGLRSSLAEDTVFAEHGPAGVAVWDRHLAYGAALGVAYGAVRELPLGAEGDREAWSSVGGRWRIVRIRYPRWIPPGYGEHPRRVAVAGLGHVAVGVLAVAATSLLSGAVGLAVALMTLGVVLVVRGVWMLYLGIADLISGRTEVEGRVLRGRVRARWRRWGRYDDRSWYLAVDDGTGDTVRAWRFPWEVGVSQGSVVRAQVTRRLRQAGGVTVVVAAPEPTAEDPKPPRPAPPPLPGPDWVAVVVGVPLTPDPDPDRVRGALDGPGMVVRYRGADSESVELVWVDPDEIESYRDDPTPLSHPVPDVGDEAYQNRYGGAVIARRGPHVLQTTVFLRPGTPAETRNDVTVAVARAVLAAIPQGVGPA